MKRNLVIISLVVSILSFGIILLSYFGITRLMCLHLYSMDHYLKNYHKLDKDKQRIVIAMTMYDPDVSKLKTTINSLLDQTNRVDQIALNIPSDKNINIPEKYTKVVNVFKLGGGKNDRDGLKATIKREYDADTKIIYVSASKIYGKDLVENLAEASNKHPDNIIYTGKPPSSLKIHDSILVKPKFYKSIDKEFIIIPRGVELIEAKSDYTF